MAIPSNTLIGKTKGSVGNVTFTTWKGRNVIKEKSNSPANPRTPAQVAQRAKFSKITAYAGFLDSFFVDVWPKVSTDVTHQNLLSKLMFPVVSSDPAQALLGGIHDIFLLKKNGCYTGAVDFDASVGAYGSVTIDPVFTEDVPTASIVARIHIYNAETKQYQILETVESVGWSVNLSSAFGTTPGQYIDTAVAYFDLAGNPVFAQITGSSPFA
jgi:hypothetical protein